MLTWKENNSMLPVCLAIFILVSYIIFISILRRRHNRFLDETPSPQTAEEAHVFTVRYIYGEFPLIATKALEFGLFKTYGIPSISRLLTSTAELVDRCPRRYDDTDLLLREIMEHPPSSPRGKAALQRMNVIHAHYPSISNVDYLYVLCIFIVEPIRWVQRFGYRSPHPKEILAMHLRWKFIGRDMGIKDIPPTYEEAANYLDRYEEKYMAYHPTNAKVANSTTDLFLSILPSLLRPPARWVVYALCPPRLRTAMGFPEPSDMLVKAMETILLSIGLLERYLFPPRYSLQTRTPTNIDYSIQDKAYPEFHPYEQTYAEGYLIDELGPVKLSGTKKKQ